MQKLHSLSINSCFTFAVREFVVFIIVMCLAFLVRSIHVSVVLSNNICCVIVLPQMVIVLGHTLSCLQMAAIFLSDTKKQK